MTIDRNLRITRISICLFYFVTGLTFASWASRIPDIRQNLSLSDGDLGLVLFAIPLGQLLMMAVSGFLVNRYGSRITLIISTIAYVMVLNLIPFTKSFAGFFAVLVAFGISANLQNIAANTQACFLENIYGRTIMPSFHGVWSLGGLSGGILGAVFAQTNMPIAAHFLAVMAMSLIVIAYAGIHLLKEDSSEETARTKPRFSLSDIDKSIMLLGVIAFCGMCCEGTLYDWSNVYFATVVKPDESLVRLGYIAGFAMMTIGRFTAGRFLKYFSESAVLKVSGSLIAIGLLATVSFPYLVPATIGFMFVGTGISSIIPICYSLAGRQNKIPTGIAITVVSSVSFIGFMIGPPVIGLISDMTNLRVALGLTSILGLAVSMLSFCIKSQK